MTDQLMRESPGDPGQDRIGRDERGFAQHIERRFLTIGSCGLVAVVILAAIAAGRLMGPLAAWLLVCSVYWSGCWLLCFLGTDRTQLFRYYRSPLIRSPVILVVTWLPPVGVLMAMCNSSTAVPSAVVIAAVVGMAIVNGATEEMFWRGAFVAAFPNQIGWGLVYPTILFTAWHVALLCIPDVVFQGGALGLLGGAAALGGLWGAVFWWTRDLRSVTMSHVAMNVFAFSMLASDNGLAGG